MMRVTISGIWTAVVLVMVFTMLLFWITRRKNIYGVINPVIMIACILMIVLRMALPFEWKFAKGIFIPELVPQIDTAVRHPLIQTGEREILVWELLLGIWGAGAAFRFIRLMWEYILARRSLKNEELLNLKYMETVKRAERDMKVSGGILYKCSGDYDVPFIFGLLKPVVMLPEACLNLNEKELYMMVCHELSHYRKKDCWTKMLLELFAGIFWWLPFMKRLIEKLDEAIEIRADQNAVRGMQEEEKTEYLLTLYHMAERAGRENGILNANTFISGQIGLLERRFRAVTNTREYRFTGLLLSIIVCGFVLSYGFVIEPKYDINDGSFSCEKSCEVYKQKDGTYQLYMDKKYVGVVDDINFLKDSDFDKIDKILVDEVAYHAME